MYKQFFDRVGLGIMSPAEQGSSAAGSPGSATDKPMTIMERIDSLLSSKVALQRELDQANATVTDLTAKMEEGKNELATLKAELQTKDDKITNLEKQISDLQAQHQTDLKVKDDEIAQLKAEATTVKDELAKLGVVAENLPGKVQSSASAPQTKNEQLEELDKKIKAATDPVEKGQLAKQWWALYHQD